LTSSRASAFCCASTFQRAGEAAQPSSSHFSCASPVIERAGSLVSGPGAFDPSPYAWSERYCRVSSTLNSASRPYLIRR
jgi:hypothetical protein